MNDYGTDVADVSDNPVDSDADIDGPDPVDLADESADLTEVPSAPDTPDDAQKTPPIDDFAEPTADNAGDEPEALADCDEPADLGRVPDAAESQPAELQDWQEGEAVDLRHDPKPDALEADAPTDAGIPDGTDLGAPEEAEVTEDDAAADDSDEDLGAPDMDTVTETDAAAETAADAPDQDAVSDAAPSSEDMGMGGAGPEGGSEGSDVGPELSIDELTEAARDEALSGDEQRALNNVDTSYAIGGEAPSDTASPWDTGMAEDEVVPAPEGLGASGAGEAADAPSDLANSPDNEALISALTDRDISLEPVDRFDYSDNPVLGYRESAPPEDIAYAVNTWNDQIAPGLASGATREDFAAYDQEHGLEGHQRLTGVYDYMLGDDAITSGGQREDGSLDVNGGRHRIEQARLHGIQYLPVRKR